MSKEIDSINSEAEKNLNSDTWRKLQILKSNSNPNHPYHQFDCGNGAILRALEPKLLKKKLQNLYNRYYTANNMKLAVLSNLSLDQLQELILNYFSDIKTNNQETIKNKYQQENIKSESRKSFYYETNNYINKSDIKNNLTNDSRENGQSKQNQIEIKKLSRNLFPKERIVETKEKPFKKNEHLGKIVFYKKISSGHSLDLVFFLDPIKNFNKIKPLDYLDYLLNYSGEKSLIKLLKNSNLINMFSAGILDSYRTFALYCISVELTDQGFEEIQIVINLIFNFLNQIKLHSSEKKIYDEVKKIADVKFKFQEKSGDYSSSVYSLSTAMFDIENHVDYANLLYLNYIHERFDKNMIQEFINKISVENSIILIGSSSVITPSLRNNFFSKADFQKEIWYGTEFIINDLSQAYRENLNNFPVTFENSGTLLKTINGQFNPKLLFELRKENLFITKINSLVYSCEKKNIKCNDDEYSEKNINANDTNVPVSLYNEETFRFYYKIDKTFNVPRIIVYIHILSDIMNKSTFNFSNFNLFFNYLEETVNNNLEEAIQTGNTIDMIINNSGITITISAYSDVIDKILKIIFTSIYNINPNNNIFSEIFDKTLINFENFIYMRPVDKNIQIFRKLVKFKHTIYTEVLDFYFDEIQSSENIEVKNKRLKFDKIQLFEHFKNFYTELKQNLIIDVLFYGNLDKIDELVSISKYIKKIVSSSSIPNLRNKIILKGNNNNNNIFVIKNDSSTNVNLPKNINKKLVLMNKSYKKFYQDQLGINNLDNNQEAKKFIEFENNSQDFRKRENIRRQVQLHHFIKDQIIFQIINNSNTEINHAVTTVYQIGAIDYNNYLSTLIIDKCLGSIFYYNLRTLQQLGYIVQGGSQEIDLAIYYVILVQGSKKQPLEIDHAINEVILLAKDKLENCETNGFLKAKEIIKNTLNKLDDNLKQRSQKIWKEIYLNRLDFERRNKMLKILDEIEFRQVYNLFMNVFIEDPHRLSIHNYAPNYKNIEKVLKTNLTMIDYDLNKQKKISLTDDLDSFKDQPYLDS